MALLAMLTVPTSGAPPRYNSARFWSFTPFTVPPVMVAVPPETPRAPPLRVPLTVPPAMVTSVLAPLANTPFPLPPSRVPL